ncbi:MAG: hypothetical protein JNL60_18780 [Bacteroidia bacterium]|nr:hypothetical protein [Bacteroidia bacterium]
MEKQRIERLLNGRWNVVIAKNQVPALENILITYNFQDSKEKCNSSHNHLIASCDGETRAYQVVEDSRKYFIRTDAFSKEIVAIGENDMLWKIEGTYYVLNRIQ